MKEKICYVVTVLLITLTQAHSYYSETYEATNSIFYDVRGYDYIVDYPHLLLEKKGAIRLNLNTLWESLSVLSSPSEVSLNKIGCQGHFVSWPFGGLNFGIVLSNLSKEIKPASLEGWTGPQGTTINTTSNDLDGDGIYDIIDKIVNNYKGENKIGLSNLGAGIALNLGFPLGISYYFTGKDDDKKFIQTTTTTRTDSSNILNYQSVYNLDHDLKNPNQSHCFLGSGQIKLENFIFTPKVGITLNNFGENIIRTVTTNTNNIPASSSLVDTNEIIGTNTVTALTTLTTSYPYLNPPTWENKEEKNNRTDFRILPEIQYNFGAGYLRFSSIFISGSGKVDNRAQDYYKTINKKYNKDMRP